MTLDLGLIDGNNWSAAHLDAVEAAINLGSSYRHSGNISRVAAQSIAATTTASISFDTETTDTDGYFPGSGPTVSIPAGLGGIYAITLSITGPAGWSANNSYKATLTGTLAGIAVGAAAGGSGGTSPTTTTWTIVVALAAAATFGVEIENGTGVARDFTGICRFYRLGA